MPFFLCDLDVCSCEYKKLWKLTVHISQYTYLNDVVNVLIQYNKWKFQILCDWSDSHCNMTFIIFRW